MTTWRTVALFLVLASCYVACTELDHVPPQDSGVVEETGEHQHQEDEDLGVLPSSLSTKELATGDHEEKEQTLSQALGPESKVDVVSEVNNRTSHLETEHEQSSEESSLAQDLESSASVFGSTAEEQDSPGEDITVSVSHDEGHLDSASSPADCEEESNPFDNDSLPPLILENMANAHTTGTKSHTDPSPGSQHQDGNMSHSLKEEDQSAVDTDLSGTSKDPEEIPTFDEWKRKVMEVEKEKTQSTHTSTNGGSSVVKKVQKNFNNYASVECGAKILGANPEAKSMSAILKENMDLYMLNPCSNKIWFIIELCERIQVKQLDMANFELFSSTPKDFLLSISDRYPTNKWLKLGTFHGRDERIVQSFPLDEHLYAKYVKVELLSHFGSEHFCPLSLIRVFGTSMVEEYDEIAEPHVRPEDQDDDLDYPSGYGPGEVKHSKNIIGSAKDVILNMVTNIAVNVLGGNSEMQGNISSQDGSHVTTPTPTTDPTTIPELEEAAMSPDVLITEPSALPDNMKEQIVIPLESEEEESIISTITLLEKEEELDEEREEDVSCCCADSLQEYLQQQCLLLLCRTTTLPSEDKHQPREEEEEEEEEEEAPAREAGSGASQTVTESHEHSMTQLEPSLSLLETPCVSSEEVPLPLSTTVQVTCEPMLKDMAEEDHLVQPEDVPDTEPPHTLPDFRSQDLTEDFSSTNLSDMYAEPPNGTEQNLLHGSSQKESVFMRLNNRIKALETNMSLSGRYLEQLSQRYRKQMEEMQKAFNQTIIKLQNTSTIAEEQDQRQTESIHLLQEQLHNMTHMVVNLSVTLSQLHNQVCAREKYLAVCVLLAVCVTLLLCAKRCISIAPPAGPQLPPATSYTYCCPDRHLTSCHDSALKRSASYPLINSSQSHTIKGVESVQAEESPANRKRRRRKMKSIEEVETLTSYLAAPPPCYGAALCNGVPATTVTKRPSSRDCPSEASSETSSHSDDPSFCGITTACSRICHGLNPPKTRAERRALRRRRPKPTCAVVDFLQAPRGNKTKAFSISATQDMMNRRKSEPSPGTFGLNIPRSGPI
ncbi:SUN domain-containing ossification factor-like [Entelurus aequoreus]|uniref:SUN domain-containing ossification factor-like n=1 Tax=Entelurus aequoreus TaxID=161455 RepID=UPI002B1E413E|nr:SUN domain-containing ossification factor-like [Entelurus aequoreus]XP_061903062.1 SUN domain-containing ossification factor-like [Entelurus aequoreus]XP_061903063.1 SUN domain-containing ossification factor-like [Entelurus aequoreus]XP_061903064.1 SUN domain-containing ossification factor-like [Entelurus aequoreus]